MTLKAKTHLSLEMKDSFCFVLNPIEVEGPLPIELIPGYWFRKANADEVRRIEEMSPFDVFALHGMKYKQEMVEINGPEPGCKQAESRLLPREKWRYHVISFGRDTEPLADLALAASLLKNDLDLGLTVTPMPGSQHGVIWQHSSDLSYFSQPCDLNSKPVVVKTSEIEEIGPNYTLLKNARQSWPNLYQTIRRFEYLKALPRNSHFSFVAHFSVLEALITHNPKLTDILDSITHQIKTKINLLSKRFQRPLDYPSVRGASNAEVVWGKMYSYRSIVAHGEEPDFTKELKVLRNSQAAFALLKETVKLVILYALREPEFIADLKRC